MIFVSTKSGKYRCIEGKIVAERLMYENLTFAKKKRSKPISMFQALIWSGNKKGALNAKNL
jgi:hypothetical protein